jgi:hypothetical protein
MIQNNKRTQYIKLATKMFRTQWMVLRYHGKPSLVSCETLVFRILPREDLFKLWYYHLMNSINFTTEWHFFRINFEIITSYTRALYNNYMNYPLLYVYVFYNIL